MQIKSEANPVKKSSKEFWQQHVKQWELSKLKQPTYCKQAGINYGTFVYWRGQFLREAGQSQSKRFVPVKVKQSQPDPFQSIKIKLLTGHVVCIPTSIGIPEVARLIRLLEVADA